MLKIEVHTSIIVQIMARQKEKDGTDHRTVEKLQIFLSPQEIFKLINIREWPYKGRGFDRQRSIVKYHARDKAFMALLFLTSGRVNAVLRIRKGQFKEIEELQHRYKFIDPDILILENFQVSKRKKGKQKPVIDIPLPRIGNLSPFTKLVEDYLSYLSGEPDETKLFPFGQSRTWVIVNHYTGGYDKDGDLVGKWCHWFRSQSLSYNVNLIGSELRVAKQRGIENPQTIAHYQKGDKERLKIRRG